MADSSTSLHRVRRLRWQARAPNAADAFALQSLLHRRSEDVSAALAQAFASVGLRDEVWHLPSLTLRLDASSLAQMDADLPTLVASALQAALARARPAETARRGDVATLSTEPAAAPTITTITTNAESAHAALRHYLATGGLPWALAGLSAEAQQQTLQSAAQAALAGLLAQGNIAVALADMLGASTPWPARIGALLRWLPLLIPSERQRWLARSPRPTGIAAALADSWLALLTSASAAPEWTALWLVWPTFRDGPQRSTSSTEAVAVAVAHWIATLPADIAAARLPSRAAPHDHLAAALLQALGESASASPASPSVRQQMALAKPIAAAPDALLVPLAGLVLLHPYLPRLLNACGLVDATGRAIDDAALPRACSVLHGLACGDTAAAEHRLPLIKLLLGRAPDAPMTAALPRLTTTDQEEIRSLLDAVRHHWKALGSTSADGLQLSFLQRRGLLRQADGAWQLHLQAEAFDLLLGLLPWSISLVKLPWMPLPLMVEWHAA